ncbi:MAG: type II toxin-antitoxin system RelE/ParE family toxin [Caldithrix sp.]|nr:MAG: type II toxin-antitoxin system RelE/ParE family toxin [Caldithrix sp.]
MKVVFSARAKTDLAEFIKFIASDKPQAARKWAANIRQSVLKLSDFPKMGRTVPEYGDETIREIIKGQYRVVYKIDDKHDTIVVVTIHHAKRPIL